MTTIIIITALILIVWMCIAFNKQSRDNDLLAEQFNADFIQTKNLIKSCTRSDAVKLINAFYDRWHGLVAEWVICAHMRNLQTYLDFEHPHLYQISKN